MMLKNRDVSRIKRIPALLLAWVMLLVTVLVSACASSDLSSVSAEDPQSLSEEEKQAEAARILSSMEEEKAVTGGSELLEEKGAVTSINSVVTTGNNENGSKTVITILEIVPHPICSVFPYLIDWSSRDKTIIQDWDDHTILGYEGFRQYLTSASLGAYDFAYMDTEMTYREHLGIKYSNYDFDLASMWNTNTRHREYYNDQIRAASGYFMYVGNVGNKGQNPKGLYAINRNSPILALNPSDTGIGHLNGARNNYGFRTAVRPMARKGIDTPKGNLSVVDPAYFVDKSDASWKDASFGIRAKTDANYEVSFAVTSQNTAYGYAIARSADVKSGTNVENTDYLAYADTGLKAKFDDRYGYEFYKNGNYTASGTRQSFTFGQYKADTLGIYSGVYYVRTSDKTDASKKDGASGVSAGFYKRVTREDTGYPDDTALYRVTFTKTDPGKGSYILGTGGVSREIADADATLQIFGSLLFEYAGSGAGYYRVDFTHAARPGNAIDGSVYRGARYEALIEEVTNYNQGRFCLTSTHDRNNAVEYSDRIDNPSNKAYPGKDYADVVCRVDFKGIHYDMGDWDAGSWYSDGFVGAAMGTAQWGGDTNGEWVFISYDEGETHNVTTKDQLQSILRNPRFGDRIYVEDQERKRCVYAINEICDNEWFKLLMYLDDPRNESEWKTDPEHPEWSLAYEAYSTHWAKGNYCNNGKQIKNAYKDEIAAFNENYEIRIITKLPSEVTVSDVEEADLTYIADYVTRPFWSPDQWNNALRARGQEWYDRYAVFDQGSYRFDNTGGDISFDVALKIYEKYVLNYEGGIMFKANTTTRSNATTNLNKLMMMLGLFDDATNFARFLPQFPDYYNDQYSFVDNSGTLHFYPNSRGSTGDTYNMGRYYIGRIEGWGIASDGTVGSPIWEQTTNVWEPKYFRVYNFIYDEVAGAYRLVNDPGLTQIWASNSWDGYGRSVLQNSSGMDNLRYAWFIGYPSGTRVGVDKVRWYADENGDGTYEKHSDPYFLPWEAFSGFDSNVGALNIFKLFKPKRSHTDSKPVVIVLNADDSSTRPEDPDTTYYYFYVDSFAALGSDEAFNVDYKVLASSTPAPALQDAKYNRLDPAALLTTQGGIAYDVKYTMGGSLISGDFVSGGILKPEVSYVDYVITATDVKGRTGHAVVRFMVRDSFMLN